MLELSLHDILSQGICGNIWDLSLVLIATEILLLQSLLQGLSALLDEPGMPPTPALQTGSTD